MERDEHGRDDGCVIGAEYWNERDALAERERLERANTEESYYFVVIEEMATVVYAEDEPPPWVDDPERLKRRGYESR